MADANGATQPRDSPPAVYTVPRACYELIGWTALPAKMGPDEAESAACGRSPCKDDNEVRPHFCRNPEGRGGFSRLLCRSSLKYARYLSLLTPCTRENLLPSLPPYKFITGSKSPSAALCGAAECCPANPGFGRFAWSRPTCSTYKNGDPAPGYPEGRGIAPLPNARRPA
jgi:hypothetical protein